MHTYYTKGMKTTQNSLWVASTQGTGSHGNGSCTEIDAIHAWMLKTKSGHIYFVYLQ